jgi:hypothetical protein
MIDPSGFFPSRRALHPDAGGGSKIGCSGIAPPLSLLSGNWGNFQ